MELSKMGWDGDPKGLRERQRQREKEEGGGGCMVAASRAFLALAALALLACGGGVPGSEQPIHAQARGPTGVIIDVKCWKMESVLYQQYGPDPHWTESATAERDCLPKELTDNHWQKQPDGYWAKT